MSSHLRSLDSGQCVQVEILSNQLTQIKGIARVRKAEIIASQPLQDGIIILTIRKN
ncbi:hypothetical protein [Maridesulfovibrio zosterae]|uniref:hypothetical protein n=1 Tax=Maridesulfovibrio zosterae TaxID=82171 RepID=UPI00041BD7F7|nr:hypothetical protein [Maridesulfovibrio zosterae]